VRAQSAQAQESAITTGNSAPFGVCETPGVAAADNIPPAAADRLKGLPAQQQAGAKQQILAGVQRACSENLAGFEQTYLVTFYAAMLALFISLFLPGWPAKWTGRAGLQGQSRGSKPATAD
jgi:hypothetical protein